MLQLLQHGWLPSLSVGSGWRVQAPNLLWVHLSALTWCSCMCGAVRVEGGGSMCCGGREWVEDQQHCDWSSTIIDSEALAVAEDRGVVRVWQQVRVDCRLLH